MTQATPGPWWINPYGARQILGQPPNPPVIATTLRWEDATLIVRAVNERPELIAALELCAGAIEPLRFKAVVSENCTIKFTGKYTHLGQHRLSEILDRANAILEKAKAQ